MKINDACDIRDSVSSGSVSAAEVAAAALKRIEQADPHLGAFITVQPDRVLERARDIDRKVRSGEARLPLAGIPVAVKDNISTRHLKTTCGSRILENYIPPFSATAVQALENAGAVVIGKTNCDEFGMGSSTENSAFHVTRNPFDLERVAGGSSGGSAAAVAAGMTSLALGSDTGGSVRQPASFCNVVGIKPTYGRISRYGLVAFASSLDVIGILASSPRDAALLLSMVAGPDGNDSTSARIPVPDYLDDLDRPLKGLRAGVPREFFDPGLDHEVKNIIDGALRNAEALGCEMEEVSLPYTPYAVADYYIIAPAEASSNLARYDGVRYGHRVNNPRDLADMYVRSRSQGFGTEVKRRIMIGTFALSSGYYEAYYGRAMKVRTLIRQDYERAFQRVDVLMAPVSPTPAFRIGEKIDDPLAMYLSDIYTVTANLAGIPAVSVPCGSTAGGLPVGLQLLGSHFQEALLLRVAQNYVSSFPVTAPSQAVPI